MARIRSIKPEFYSDTTLADLPLMARYFYIGLFCQLDRQGLTIEDPKLLKREIFPYDDDITIKAIETVIDGLIQSGRLKRFEYQGKRFLFCPNFSKHQKFHKDEKIKYEIPQEILLEISQQGADEVSEGCQEGATRVPTLINTGAKRPVSCITVSGIPVSCIPENCITETPEVPSVSQTPSKLDFETLYREYPLKEGKAEGLKHCKSQIKTQDQYDKLQIAIRKYRQKCEREGLEKKYIKHFSTFMSGGKWRDFLEPDVGTSSINSTDEPFNIGRLLAEKGQST